MARTKKPRPVGWRGVPESHLLRIARDNWRNPAKARFLGGPTPEEARSIILSLTGKDPGPPPVDERLTPNPPGKRVPTRAATRQAHAGKFTGLTVGQLELAALKAFPSSPRQLAIRGEINRRLARGERAWTPPVGHRWGPKKKNPPRRPGDDSGWGPGSGYQSAGAIKTVAQLKKVATELLARVHGSSVMASAAQSALRAPDYFMARPSLQADLLDMHRRYVTEERGRRRNPVSKRRRTRVVLGSERLVRLRNVKAKVRTVQAILRPKRRRGIVRGVNPPAGQFLGRVERLEYIHAHDGKPYFHDFTPRAYMVVQEDGTILLYHPSHKLWKPFAVPDQTK